MASRAPRRRGVPLSDLLRVSVTRVIPFGLAVGAFMETFMFYTGFWGTATRKEAERQAERRATLDALKQRDAAGLHATSSVDGKLNEVASRQQELK